MVLKSGVKRLFWRTYRKCNFGPHDCHPRTPTPRCSEAGNRRLCSAPSDPWRNPESNSTTPTTVTNHRGLCNTYKSHYSSSRNLSSFHTGVRALSVADALDEIAVGTRASSPGGRVLDHATPRPWHRAQTAFDGAGPGCDPVGPLGQVGLGDRTRGRGGRLGRSVCLHDLVPVNWKFKPCFFRKVHRRRESRQKCVNKAYLTSPQS